MSVLAWIASALGIAILALLGLVVLGIVGALVSTLHVDARLDTAGPTGRIRWGVARVDLDAPADRVDVRLVGLRVARRSLSRGRRPERADEDSSRTAGGAGSKDERRGRRRARLPVASYRRLARTAIREVRGMARHLHVERLSLDLTLASDDPAWTGEAYGLACAVAAWVRARWPHADLRLSADFTASRPYGAAELAASVRPVRLIPGVARVALRYWTERRRSRRRASGARATVAARP